MGRKWEISYISNSIGETYLLMKNYSKAYEYFNEALRTAEQLQNRDILLFSYRSLTKYYSAVGDYAQFDNFFHKYEETKDAIFTNQNTSSIAEMQVKYETERKEKENALQKLQIAKQRSLKNSFIFLSILVLIIVVILFFRFQVKKKPEFRSGSFGKEKNPRSCLSINPNSRKHKGSGNPAVGIGIF